MCGDPVLAFMTIWVKNEVQLINWSTTYWEDRDESEEVDDDPAVPSDPYDDEIVPADWEALFERWRHLRQWRLMC